MITGIEITKVEANKKSTEVISNVKFNINFDGVTAKEENLDVSFVYAVAYETGSGSEVKNAGDLTISGRVMAKETKKDAEDILQAWQGKKSMPKKFTEALVSLLNFECGARGTLAAYSIGLIPPLQFSRVTLQEEQGKK